MVSIHANNDAGVSLVQKSIHNKEKFSVFPSKAKIKQIQPEIRIYYAKQIQLGIRRYSAKGVFQHKRVMHSISCMHNKEHELILVTR